MDGISAMLARQIIPSIALLDDARRQEPRPLARACCRYKTLIFKHIAAQNRYLDG
ncbi:hypothetical protein [Novosphingobium sp.]|uniref:hypothetical protein n=1 Tax=Novosphingobium sp. TaxID=1874826 RepID=UPI0031D96428